MTHASNPDHRSLRRVHPAIDVAIHAIEHSGIRWALPDDSVPPCATDEANADIVIAGADARRVRAILREHRFMAFPACDRQGQRSFVSYDRPTDRWVQVRIHTALSHGRAATIGRMGVRYVGAVQRVVCPSRRPGMTVALLGPDGSGKSTLARHIERCFPLPVRLVYLGLWQRTGDPGRRSWLPGWTLSGRLVRAWRQCLVGQYHRMLGRLVLFDRYTYDALLSCHEGRSWLDRSYSWLLGHACPEPDLILVLDAPGPVMYARKHESSPERLEAERQGFLSLRRRFPQLQVVDATCSPEELRADVVDRIWRRYFGRD